MRRIAWVLFASSALGACQTFAPTRPVDAPTRAADTVLHAAGSQRPDYVATPRLADVGAFVRALPPATTLVVFDIDDTLLGTPFASGPSGTRRFFGSDAWYNWQVDPRTAQVYKLPTACLYEFLAINYEVDTEVPTDGAAATVKGIAADKILLTSRSPDYRGGTERELRRAGILPIRQLTMDANVFVRTPDGVPMTYVDGVYMTRGADKGEALFALLRTLGIEHKYSHVILVDDGWKNITSMHAAVAARNIEFKGFLYTGVKEDPAATGKPLPELEPTVADSANEAWRAWLDALGTFYPERKARFDGGCR